MLLRAPERGSGPPAGARTRRARPRPLVVVALLVLVLVASLGTLVDRLGDGAPVVFEEAPRLAQLPEYGADGSDVLGYDHGERVELTVELRNRWPVPVRIVDVDALPGHLAMLVVESATVEGVDVADGPGVRVGPFSGVEVTVVARFDNCEYYTERAVDRFDSARVGTSLLGIPRHEQVTLDHQLLVRGPTILGCPDRVMDRSARQRGADASIRG
jgi:hypothetical protein